MTGTSDVLIVAGEVSGDIHAGNLLREMRKQSPGIRAFGIGGDELEAAGLECLARTEELSHMGLFEVIRELPRIYALKGRLIEEARSRRPRVAVLVDSPDFNLRLAKNLKQIGITVVFYVSPQLWAWRSGRVKTVRRLAEEVLCILPFETAFYDQHGVRARYVGHPLVDDVARGGLFNADFEVVPEKLALLPGSRRMEIRSLLPTMVESIRKLPESRIRDIVLLEAPGVADVIDEALLNHGEDIRIRRVKGDERRHELSSCALAWTASGTATIECALLNVPMIVGYRLHALTYALAKTLVRVPHVALVNLIAEQRIAPELIQAQWNANNLIAETNAILGDNGATQRNALTNVRCRLGGPGASKRASDAVVEVLEREHD